MEKSYTFKNPRTSYTFYKACFDTSFTNTLLLILSQIPNGNSSELIFNTVHVKDAGFYVCRVNNNFTFEFSQWSQLDVCDVTEVTESFQGKWWSWTLGKELPYFIFFIFYFSLFYFKCLLSDNFKVSKYCQKLAYVFYPV